MNEALNKEALFIRGFGHFSAVNLARAARWHKGSLAEWSTLEWAGAMCGEAGEAANVAKKIRRVELGIASAKNEPIEELRKKLAGELADVFIYLDLVAQREGINLALAVIKKFNEVSEREGMPERI